MRALTDEELLRALEPVAGKNLERHLATARDWLPHEWVPWSRGRDFAGEIGAPWRPDDWHLSDAARTALTLNLLTEDNLPSYHHELLDRVGHDGAWGAWVRRWTAEEARHATSLRDYVLLSRAVDPAALEHDRMATMQSGWRAAGKGLLRALIYAAFQEAATRIAHRNTGLAVRDPPGERLLNRIAADEALHMLFYRDVVGAALTLAPEQTLIALAQELASFEMPGSGVKGYLHKSVLMAEAGIYDVRMHRDEVIVPMLKHWQALTLAVEGAAAIEAQQDLGRQLDRLEVIAKRFEHRRARRTPDACT
jgi:acyl-[acyl-carrier-protein] desaturase